MTDVFDYLKGPEIRRAEPAPMCIHAVFKPLNDWEHVIECDCEDAPRVCDTSRCPYYMSWREHYEALQVLCRGWVCACAIANGRCPDDVCAVRPVGREYCGMVKFLAAPKEDK